MAKIKLGASPKSFKHNITVTMLDGSKDTIQVEYKYRTRTEFAEFVNELYPEIKNPEPVAEGATVDVVESAKKAQAREVENIMRSVDGWNLPDEFNRENVEQLVAQYPAVATAIIRDYRTAITEGRLGN